MSLAEIDNLTRIRTLSDYPRQLEHKTVYRIYHCSLDMYWIYMTDDTGTIARSLTKSKYLDDYLVFTIKDLNRLTLDKLTRAVVLNYPMNTNNNPLLINYTPVALLWEPSDPRWTHTPLPLANGMVAI